MAVLNVGGLHRNEHDIRIKTFHDEVRGVRQQCIILLRIDVWSGRARLPDGEADEMTVELDTLRFHGFDRQLFGLEEEGRVGREMDLASNADVFEETIALAIAH
jgi:hypothetical protein